MTIAPSISTWQPQAILAALTSLRVGGTAQWLALPRSVSELQAVLTQWQGTNLPLTILGAGSNMLISDRGLSGLVIGTKHLRGVVFDETTGRVAVAAGESVPRLAAQAAERGWSGLEWAIGIPGTVGGMVVMNAGAQGGCAADCVQSVEILSGQGSHTLSATDLHYSYRSSVLQTGDRLVTGAVLQLTPGCDPAVVRQCTQANWQHRHSTQPYHLPSCGSVFRNPPPPRSAGWLIEQTGLKGLQIGNAQVAERHANFILNLGGATATDIYSLIRLIQQKVAERWSIHLEPEVKMIGEFP